MSSSLTSSLSLELCCRIFRAVLFDDMDMDPRDIVEFRFALCGTSSVWRRILVGTPTMWSFVFVGFSRPLESSMYALSLSGSAPLRFYFALTQFRPYARRTHDSRPVAVVVTQLVTNFLTFFPRAVDIHVDADDPLVLPIVRGLMPDVGLPMLAVFVLRYLDTTFSVALGTFVDAWPVAYERSARILHFRSVPISLPARPLPFLRVLRLFSLPIANHALASFCHVLSASPALTEVVLHYVTLFATDITTLPSVCSQSVVSLDIAFAPDSVFAALAARFDFPALHTLTLDTAFFPLACSQLFRCVTHLTLSDRRRTVPIEHVLPVMDLFPYVRTLDLRLNNGYLFELLVSALVVAQVGSNFRPNTLHGSAVLNPAALTFRLLAVSSVVSSVSLVRLQRIVFSVSLDLPSSERPHLSLPLLRLSKLPTIWCSPFCWAFYMTYFYVCLFSVVLSFAIDFLVPLSRWFA
ncbi:hypothetical protein B0H11DRAFT_2263038 [Mycena galericulata]|nr:hypothetical protein B0H11DRAFT_2263038 [Mycena galericulata]